MRIKISYAILMTTAGKLSGPAADEAKKEKKTQRKQGDSRRRFSRIAPEKIPGGKRKERRIMKKILAMAAVAALAAGASAYAANPFSDVSTSDWAYQAVADLSDQGIVEGYPDGTFKGQTNITRYEMAQIVARLMAKEDQYNAEQRATIDKLAAEYADELDSLGVRVSNLEKKVGNISWSGDARMRYQSKDNSADEAWTGRIRINMKGQVNDSTTVNARLSTDSVNFEGDDDADVGMEVLNVNHDFGAWDVTLGRFGNSFGNQGGWLYGSAWGFDGAQVAADFGKVNVAVGYGQFNSAKETVKYDDATGKELGDATWLDNQDTFYAKADADFGAFDLYANYYTNMEGNAPEWRDYDIWGVGLVVPVSDFRVFGEYWQNTTAPNSTEDTAWNAGIGYGKRDLKKVGSWQLDLAYNDVGSGVYLGGTGLQTDVLKTLSSVAGMDADKGYDSISFWNAIAEVTLMQNMYLHAEYAFGTDGDNAGSEGADIDDSWTVSLNYVF